MKKKYKLCSRAGSNSKKSQQLEDFTEEEYIEYSNGELDLFIEEELTLQAMQQQDFEWWIEEELE